MQTLQFWNSIKECGLPALVHTYKFGADSEPVLLYDANTRGSVAIGHLSQFGPTDNPKINWEVKDDSLCPIHTFTHWAYIPAVPKN